MTQTRPWLVGLIALATAMPAWSTDACSERAVVTAANVMVSDGTSFQTQSYFHTSNAAAIRHIRDGDATIVVVEGPIAWARRGEETQSGPDHFKRFAFGHQYHALLLYFDEIAPQSRRSERVQFAGKIRSATTADYPYGGLMHLVHGDHADQPAGILFEFPGGPPISAEFRGWRASEGTALPYHIRIVDGERVFDYHYTDIDVARRSPDWFFDAIPAPDIDELRLYRLHRQLLAAHCTGDAGRIAALSAPEVVTATRGEIRRSSGHELRERFATLFQRLDYTAYVDRVEPVIEVSGESAWMLVEVQARGSVIEGGAQFDDQWAWAMLARKIDGAWRHVGNASNRKQ